MLFIMGFQSILMGLIAELLARTYHESQDKPTYTVRRVVGAALPVPAKPAQPEMAQPEPGPDEEPLAAHAVH